MKRLYLAAVYMHCTTHVLYLAISKASDVADIADCVSTIEDTTTFVRSLAKRMKALH